MGGPNPVEDILSISAKVPIDGNTTLSIFDARGAVIREFSHPENFSFQSVDFSELASGLYWLRISNTGSHQTHKLVVK